MPIVSGQSIEFSPIIVAYFYFFFKSHSPDVTFCGYTVPHPADTTMHLRIQTVKDVKAIDVLRRGLTDLEQVCDHTLETFGHAYDEYQQLKKETTAK